MTISSASLLRALTTSSINNLSHNKLMHDAENNTSCGLINGIRSWYQAEQREHKKNEFSTLTWRILEEFANNENTASITIKVNGDFLVISEYPDSVNIIFLEKTNTLNNMTLKDFVTRIKVDRALNAELYGIPNRKGQRLNDSSLVLTGANLRNMDLSNADLSGLNLYSTNLSGANMSGAKLCYTNLSRADLSSANLTGANLTVADLSGANLSGANLTDVNLTMAILAETKLQDTTVHLQLHCNLTLADMDYHFNHIANGNSLLITVDSIDDYFFSLKIDLIHQILQAINQSPQIDLSLFYKNFYLLLNHYYNDDIIKVFLTDKVILPTIEQANSQAWSDVDQKMCEVLLEFVDSKNDFDYIKNNGFFVQLVLNSLSYDDTVLKGKAECLYEHYLSLERIKPFTLLDDFGAYGENRVDWSDLAASNYVLVCDNITMLISSENLKNMLTTNEIATAWNHFFLYRHGGTTQGMMIEETPDDMDALFKAFKIFDQQYQFYKNATKIVGILELLKLDNYHDDFIAALDRKHIKKMISPDIQMKLGSLFANVISYNTENHADMRLRPEHYQEIIDKFELTNAEETVKAQTLFCLAAIFTRYSSSYIFGTEYHSPQAIRQYAFALMNEAKFQRSGMIDISLFSDWKNRLLGLDNAFACTAVLFTVLTDYARDKFPHILNRILPPAWK